MRASDVSASEEISGFRGNLIILLLVLAKEQKMGPKLNVPWQVEYFNNTENGDVLPHLRKI